MLLRRLPFYLLLDTSESMVGEPIRQLKNGVDFMLGELNRNPYALETVWLCVITFADKAVMATPLSDISEARIPDLTVAPGTSLGAALAMARDSMDRDVRKSSPSQKGDYRPVVFILTDGEPTDEWKKPLSNLTDIRPAPALVSVGCGDDADPVVLSAISPVSIRIADLDAEAFKSFFVWLSSSVGGHSHAVGSNSKADLLKRPLPQGIELVKSGEWQRGQAGGRPRLFLHARCRISREPYIMIYKYDSLAGVYLPQGSEPLPSGFFSSGTPKLPPLKSSMLDGAPKCPHCGSDSWFICGNCGNLACWDEADSQELLVCPSCGAKGARPVENEFSVTGSIG